MKKNPPEEFVSALAKSPYFTDFSTQAYSFLQHVYKRSDSGKRIVMLNIARIPDVDILQSAGLVTAEYRDPRYHPKPGYRIELTEAGKGIFERKR